MGPGRCAGASARVSGRICYVTGCRAAVDDGACLPRVIRRVFTLSKKKRVDAGPEQIPPAETLPASAADETGELKQFVDNYLTLADKALGFARRPGPNNLTISTCMYCQHTIAGSSLKLLAFAENLHVCPARHP